MLAEFFRTTRHAAFALVTVAFVASAAGLGAAADPYTIDVILPITGPGAFVGTTHQKELTALEAVVNKQGGIQGRPVQFVFHDDQTNPSVSLQLVDDVVAKHPAVIMGSSLGALCSATMAAIGTGGAVQYCFSPVIAPPKGGYVFSASVSGVDLIRVSLRYMRARGWKHFATLNTTDGSGQIADRDIGNLLKTPEFADMQLVTAEHFNPTDTSVTAQVSKIKALAPQAVIVWSPGTPFGTALHGIQDVGLDVPVVTTSANMIVTQLKQYANVIPKSGIYFQSVAYVAGVSGRKESPAMTTFVTAIKSAGLAQDFQSGVAWDPAMIVIDGLRKLGPNATGPQLQSYLAGLHDYVGITGTYDFREAPQRGLTVDDALIERWDPDKLDFVQVSKFGGAPL